MLIPTCTRSWPLYSFFWVNNPTPSPVWTKKPAHFDLILTLGQIFGPPIFFAHPTFRERSGKLLEFMVSECWMKLNPGKQKANKGIKSQRVTMKSHVGMDGPTKLK